MAENLRTTAYYDGTAIPLETDNNEWYNLTTPAYCWYYNDSATYSAEYGVLYNWYAVITDNICPIGWHVSTHSEWVTMINYLGGISVAGAKLKEKGTTHWNNPNTGATNESGFNGLPAGRRDPEFCTLGDFGNFWTSTQTSATHAWGHSLVNNAIYVCGGGYEKMNGYSVRCVKD